MKICPRLTSYSGIQDNIPDNKGILILITESEMPRDVLTQVMIHLFGLSCLE